MPGDDACQVPKSSYIHPIHLNCWQTVRVSATRFHPRYLKVCGGAFFLTARYLAYEQACAPKSHHAWFRRITPRSGGRNRAERNRKRIPEEILGQGVCSQEHLRTGWRRRTRGVFLSSIGSAGFGDWEGRTVGTASSL